MCWWDVKPSYDFTSDGDAIQYITCTINLRNLRTKNSEPPAILWRLMNFSFRLQSKMWTVNMKTFDFYV